MQATFNVNQAPQSSPCTYSLSLTSKDIECSSGADNFRVITQMGCKWTATSNFAWIQVTSGASGIGTGTVYYKVTKNPASSYRTGQITIKDENNQVRANFRVNQGVCCTYSLSSTSRSFGCSDGAGGFTVNTGSGCEWSSASNASWIRITSGSNGNGDGTVSYSVFANPGNARTGQINIKDENNQVRANFNVNQAPKSSPCTYTLSPTSKDFICSGGTDSFRVITQMGCQWTAVTAASYSAWIQITSGASGIGTGTVYYKVLANTQDSDRIGTVTIKDQTDQLQTSFIINQYGQFYTNPVPDTGQTKDYTITFGEDSDYSINPHSYTKLDAQGRELDINATSWAMVRDNVTSLIWEVKTDDGTIHDKDTKYTWQEAQDVFIAKLNSSKFGGYTDWRMPTVKELSFITDRGRFNPAIDTDYFPETMSSYYWSSTTYARNPGDAWRVYFFYGFLSSYDKSSSRYVRAVRGGQ